MREILFRGKRMDNGKWVEGYLYEHEPALVGIVSENDVPEPSKWLIARTGFADWNMPRPVEFVEVDLSTVGQYTGLIDKNGVNIFEGDIVALFGMKGKVVQECGAFGIGFMKTIDYDLLESKMPFNNSANFCFNDNFISLWEVFWNYEQDDNPLYEVEVIGNIHDNPELLEK